jgi:tRNA-(ms[2]io[6]A)-hydroxylase
MAGDGKRHLPVVPSAPPADPEEDRPPWHWSAIGVVGIFVFWLPLSMLAGRLAADSGPRAQMGVHGAAYALACFSAGLLVGRFGGRAGRREAALGGVAAAIVATLLAANAVVASTAQLAFLLGLMVLVLALLGGGAAWAGAALGLRRRPPTPSA